MTKKSQSDTDDAAAFWESVERTAEEVRTWPSWMKVGVVVDPINFVTFMPEPVPAVPTSKKRK
jgi:hypothetical protein